MSDIQSNDTSIAIIGADIRAPGAQTLEQFMDHILNGTEALEDVSNTCEAHPDMITRRPVLEGVDRFDPDYFGLSKAESIKLDPQHRHFLMLCRSLLHKSAVDPKQIPNIGVVASCDENLYVRNVLAPALGANSASAFSDYVSSEKDFVATRVSYHLGLTGPAYTVQTACSSSLVAVHQAILALRAGECDACIAGGVSIQFPHGKPVAYVPGMIYSKDGSCRPFDAQADGTNLGSGAAAVLLCRHEDAIARGDKVLAVIRGSALNNDGNRKMSYTAPSPTGQQRAIETALRCAGNHADNIAFVETHGTATRLGDPIEFRSLSKALQGLNAQTEHTALTGLKANFGHLSCAAGVAGLIKAALCLDARVIPRMTNFQSASPMVRLSGSPFRVLTQNEPMTSGQNRALVTSFGIGGTNAVVVLETPQEQPAPQMIPGQEQVSFTFLSDDRQTNLERNIERLADQHSGDETPERPFGWVGSRLSETGAYRGFVLKSDTGETTSGTSSAPVTSQPNVCFVFPGQGAFPMALMQRLYMELAEFRSHFDRAAAAFSKAWQSTINQEITGTPPVDLASQPLQFTCQIALLGVLEDRGVHASMRIGHSLGEFAAMVSANILSLQEAATLVSTRDEAMRKAPSGGMLVLKNVSAEDVAVVVAQGCQIAAINGGGQITMSGSAAQINAAKNALEDRNISATSGSLHVLAANRGFHRKEMRASLQPLEEAAQKCSVPLHPTGFISTLTGRPLAPDDILSAYFIDQASKPVLFSSAVETALQAGTTHFVEIGQSFLSGWATQKGAHVLSLLDPFSPVASVCLFTGLGKLWAAGLPVTLPKAPPHDVLSGSKFLPNYAFETIACWPETVKVSDPVPSVKTPKISQDRAAQNAPRAPAAMTDTLCRLFQRHLDLAEVRADAEFSALGLNSMMAITLCSEIHRETGVQIDMSKFMELGSLRRLEDWLTRAKAA